MKYIGSALILFFVVLSIHANALPPEVEALLNEQKAKGAVHIFKCQRDSQGGPMKLVSCTFYAHETTTGMSGGTKHIGMKMDFGGGVCNMAYDIYELTFLRHSQSAGINIQVTSNIDFLQRQNDAEQRRRDAEQRGREAEQRAREAEQRAREAEQRAAQRAREAEQRVRKAEQRRVTDEIRRADAEQMRAEGERRRAIIARAEQSVSTSQARAQLEDFAARLMREDQGRTNSMSGGLLTMDMSGGVIHVKSTPPGSGYSTMRLNVSTRLFGEGYEAAELTVGTTEGLAEVYELKTTHGTYTVYESGGYRVINYISPRLEPFGRTPDNNPEFLDKAVFTAHLLSCGVRVEDDEQEKAEDEQPGLKADRRVALEQIEAERRRLDAAQRNYSRAEFDNCDDDSD